MSRFNILNFIGLQLGWFVTVYASGHAYPWAGLVFTLTWLSLHFAYVDNKSADLWIVIAAAVFGYLADSLLVMTGLITFPESAQLGAPTSLWMVALWINFALTLRHCLGWIRGQYLVAMIAGAVFGPLAYYAGERLSAITLGQGWFSAIAIGIEWVVAMVLLLWITEKAEASESDALESIFKRFARG